ncbi:helix-turn-helix domain-containing protein [Ferroacidibacillus organovorans]|uniref:HTH cro/C1-type domain-containing protein n=1 Tax=Ferroacidibacillus organovorans TaxID=1765683 RepID=A0A101XQK5_9BACL|nr:helix-turn-helix transcriptional regulator [Ferroacidibacillus organovorans]KUO95710.1 hypothetical protein ATW55_13245 [Ferroacidibacillus organovorans]
MTSIGQRIRELRLSRGMTQTQLAKDIVTPSMISQIEAGKAQPSSALLRKIAERLDAINELEEVTQDEDAVRAQGIEIAKLCLALGRFAEAQEVLSQWGDEIPNVADVYFLLGQISEANRRLDEAYSRYHTALSLAKEQHVELMPEILKKIGDLHMLLQDQETAAYLYRKTQYVSEEMQLPQGILQSKADVLLSSLRSFHVPQGSGQTHADDSVLTRESPFPAHPTFAAYADKMLRDTLDGWRNPPSSAGTTKIQQVDQLRTRLDARAWISLSLDATILAAKSAIQSQNRDQCSAFMTLAKHQLELAGTPQQQLSYALLEALWQETFGKDIDAAIKNMLETYEKWPDPHAERAEHMVRWVQERPVQDPLKKTVLTKAFQEQQSLGRYDDMTKTSKLLIETLRASDNTDKIQDVLASMRG